MANYYWPSNKIAIIHGDGISLDFHWVKLMIISCEFNFPYFF